MPIHHLHIYTEDAFARDIVLRALALDHLDRAPITVAFSNGDGALRKEFIAHNARWRTDTSAGTLPLAMPDGDEGGRRLLLHKDMVALADYVLPIGDDTPENLTACAMMDMIKDTALRTFLHQKLIHDHHAIFSRIADAGLADSEDHARQMAVDLYLNSDAGTIWRNALAQFIAHHQRAR